MTINTVRTKRDLHTIVERTHQAGKTIGLVPTMGALHDGHLSLVRQAKKNCDVVCVTLFVNPTQFGPGEDFSAYPRDEEKDKALLQSVGADLLYAPSVDEMYPDGTAATISAGKLGSVLDGKFRPGHFDGVATVVARLFAHSTPDKAFFGEKDYQQLLVIKQMVAQQKIPVEITGVATVRENDGLALSSRNAYLNTDERKIAPLLYQTMAATAQKFVDGAPSHELIVTAEQKLINAGFASVDYIALVDGGTLEPLEIYSPTASPVRILGAAKLGRARLIDNLAVMPR